ncbi:MAG TPA: hypothetical protein VML54_03850 [Candidatus Limnocylindrales bacterium]|nr:hypothetical protein [Candidatus Limnocylindrales bacterium]
MKGLLLALACSTATALGVTLLFAGRNITRRAAAMCGVFLLTALAYPAAYWLTPRDLGILPPRLVEPCAWLDGAFGLVVHAALFFGGWLQVYNLAERGFSLRILIDIAEAPARVLTGDQVAARYGGGRGAAWMREKRIDGLVETGLAAWRDGRLRVTPEGRRTARLFGRLRTVLRIDTRQ